MLTDYSISSGLIVLVSSSGSNKVDLIILIISVKWVAGGEIYWAYNFFSSLNNRWNKRNITKWRLQPMPASSILLAFHPTPSSVVRVGGSVKTRWYIKEPHGLLPDVSAFRHTATQFDNLFCIINLPTLFPVMSCETCTHLRWK